MRALIKNSSGGGFIHKSADSQSTKNPAKGTSEFNIQPVKRLADLNNRAEYLDKVRQRSSYLKYRNEILK